MRIPFEAFFGVIGVLWIWIVVGIFVSVIKRLSKQVKKQNSRKLKDFEKMLNNKEFFKNKDISNEKANVNRTDNKSKISTREYSKKLRDEYEDSLYRDSEIKENEILEAERLVAEKLVADKLVPDRLKSQDVEFDKYFDPNFKVIDDSDNINHTIDISGSEFNLKDAIIAKEILDKPLSLRK